MPSRRTLAVFVLSMLGGFACKKPSESVAVKRDDDAQPLAPIDAAAAAEASSTAVTDAGPPPIPTIACDEGPDVRWNVEPADAFSCSPLRASAPGTWADEMGAPVTPLELAVAPGTEFTLDLSVKDAKGGKPTGKVRHELRGLPGDVRVDASTQTLHWSAKGRDGDVLRGSVATFVKLAAGEKCVRKPVVVRLVDTDTTRANQAAHQVRLQQFYRKLDCMFAHQGPDLAENGVNDVRDEVALRKQLQCGAPLVTVLMKDVDGDGLRDALVRFEARPNRDPKGPDVPKWETGFSTQVLLRKGDAFVRVAETPGDPQEAEDGSVLFLDSYAHDRGHHCPPRPYRSTGGPSCPMMDVDVSRWVSGHVEKVVEFEGAPNPAAAGDMLSCPRQSVEIVKDAKGRVVGFRTGGKTVNWKGASTTAP
ncbi:MAG: hypothetical protein IPJ34_22665 [Myxococcales bacterium]|nr:hypothetical protein [Myxococcales bacterium]